MLRTPCRPPPCCGRLSAARAARSAGGGPRPPPPRADRSTPRAAGEAAEHVVVETERLKGAMQALRAELDAAGGALHSSTLPATLPVEFRITYNTRLGQDIWLVGSSPHLGDWSVAAAVRLNWSNGGVWKAVLDLPTGGIFFYKFFMKQDGYLKEWQGGGNAMLVVPANAHELAGASLPLVAESCWPGSPGPAALAAESLVVARLHAAEAVVGQAEAAARAAGLVAQTVMGELLSAREEAAAAVRFIRQKGLEAEFCGSGGAAGLPPRSAAAAAAAPPPPRAGESDLEIDRQINETLAAQLAGALDLSEPAAGLGRRDLSLGGGAFEMRAAPAKAKAAPRARKPEAGGEQAR